jgi:hypothetical protein
MMDGEITKPADDLALLTDAEPASKTGSSYVAPSRTTASVEQSARAYHDTKTELFSNFVPKRKGFWFLFRSLLLMHWTRLPQGEPLILSFKDFALEIIVSLIVDVTCVS